MRKEEFRTWLQEKGYKKKPISDCLSRCRQVERLAQLDLDEEFKRDGGEEIREVFKYGIKDERNQKKVPYDFSSGIVLRFRSNDLRAAIKKYFSFCEETIQK